MNLVTLSRIAWACVAWAGLMAAAPAVAGPVLERIRQSGRIALGTRESSVPFSYVPSPGAPAIGYSIDLCQLLVEAVRKKLSLPRLSVEFVPLTSANRIEAVVQGKVDLECESTTNNAERRNQVAFTVPHYITGARYLVRADSSIHTLHDFEGKTLVSTTGTAPLRALRQAGRDRSLNIRVVEVADHAQGLDMVEKGTADGFVMDEVLLVALLSGRPDPARFAVVGKYLTVDALGIMLPQGDPEFKQLIDAEMKRLIQAREAQTLHDRWFVQPIAPRGRSLNLPMNYLLKDFWRYPSDWVPN